MYSISETELFPHVSFLPDLLLGTNFAFKLSPNL